MPKIQCQHCKTSLAAFDKICPNCEQAIRSTTAVQFIGEGLSECLTEYVKIDPVLAKKKTALYLKLCQSFLCDSELALLSVRMFGGSLDDATSEAIEDVIGAHRQHAENLRAIFSIISDEPSLAPVAKRINNIGKRIDALLKTWLLSDFGGRSF